MLSVIYLKTQPPHGRLLSKAIVSPFIPATGTPVSAQRASCASPTGGHCTTGSSAGAGRGNFGPTCAGVSACMCEYLDNKNDSVSSIHRNTQILNEKICEN